MIITIMMTMMMMTMMMSGDVNRGPSCRSFHGELRDEGEQRLWRRRSLVSNMNE